ncbi:MAG TPA: type II toxin-antitoxin system prevent-host-death family antitoxin [Chloroflexota bacterium]|nr:type II toxin-antitoxin system prevent-host-death family antitoxin [Chloroflexota bacterium]HUM67982.1 type II toxin-antitoxin system prevent-host-death family antitoxin [Chloroflexota bacterium]
MTIQVTYSQARENLAQLWDEVTENKETIIITRRGSKDVALVSAAELASLEETAYLLRSPKNAERLLTALSRSKAGEGVALTLEELRAEVGFDEETN